MKPNFCGPSQKRQSPGEDFVYAGRLSEEKGIYDLAAGWAGPAKLVVLGDGDLRPRLEALANDRVGRCGDQYHPRRFVASLREPAPS